MQATVETALATVLRCEVTLTVAGRTDAGVNAIGQVAHGDLSEAAWATAGGRELAVRRLAGVLPEDVRVLSVAVAPPDFDARFSALSRAYRYRVSDAPWGVHPLRRADTVAHRRPLDLDRLRQASRPLLGEHDFAAFCRRREGATTVRRLLRLDWHRAADDELDGGDVLVGTVEADAFCHFMVRSLVGALLMVGEGRRPVEWPALALARRTREGVPVAPAHGLTLLGVHYPPATELASRATLTRRLRSASA